MKAILCLMLILLMLTGCVSTMTTTECPSCGRQDLWSDVQTEHFECQECGAIYNPNNFVIRHEVFN